MSRRDESGNRRKRSEKMTPSIRRWSSSFSISAAAWRNLGRRWNRFCRPAFKEHTQEGRQLNSPPASAF